MNMRYLLFLLSLSPLAINAMEREKQQQAPHILNADIINADTECLVCFQSAQLVTSKFGPQTICVTDCCKHFLCLACFNTCLKKMNQCPHRCKGPLTAKAAVVESLTRRLMRQLSEEKKRSEELQKKLAEEKEMAAQALHMAQQQFEHADKVAKNNLFIATSLLDKKAAAIQLLTTKNQQLEKIVAQLQEEKLQKNRIIYLPPLFAAIKHFGIREVNQLLNLETTNINQKTLIDGKELTPLGYALLREKHEIAEFLEQKGATL